MPIFDTRPRAVALATAISTLLFAAQSAAARDDAGGGDAVAEAGGEPGAIEEVVVLGKNIPEPMRETSEVASFLTDEDLVRTGDASAALALTRVTGLTLTSGKFVYVRGLGERYSAALLNGSPLPSPEPLQRVVPLDLFPSSILGGVTVQKSYSADYPGEFGGGLIALQTRAVPDEAFFSVSIGSDYDAETTFKPGLTYYGSRTDWLGYDGGRRNLPSGLRALASDRRLTTLPADQRVQVARTFENSSVSVLQQVDDVDPDASFSLSGGRTFEVAGNALGVIAVLGHESEWQTRRGRQDYGRIDEDRLVTLSESEFVSTQRDVTWNGLLSVGYETGDHDLRWTNLWVRNTTKEARTSDGFNVNLGSSVREDNLEWFERELLMTQLTGEHRIGALAIDWRASYAETTRDVPYENLVQYGRDATGRLRHNPSSDLNRTRFSDLEDSAQGAGIDFTYELDVSFLREARLRAGYSYLKNDRDSRLRSFRYRSTPEAGGRIQYDRIDYIKSDYYLSNGLVSLEETTPLDGTAAYRGDLKVDGAYLLAESELVPQVRASLGVRLEDGRQRVATVNFLNDAAFRPSARTLDERYWLPSATLTWNFADDMQLRFGASKTIARPQFRELSPQQFLDPETDRTNVGNDSLVDTQLQNFDLRYEWFFGEQQYFALGGFYKKIDRPIEAYIFEPSQYTIWQSYINAPEARLYGAEIEGKKYYSPDTGIAWIDGRRWLVQANYTYTTSTVNVGAGDQVAPPGLGGALRPAGDYILDGSRLQGQSRHIANLQVGWEDEAARSQATLLLNYASERVLARGNVSSGQPDFVEKPGLFLDAVYRREMDLAGHGLTLSLEARNLLATRHQEYQQFGGGRVDVNVYDLGRTCSVGVTARF
jgi:outer membrane receptor protein involved in Fe transport